jgi:hypothetical protein
MGIHEKTLQRARRTLGIQAWEGGGYPGVWMWGPRSNEGPTQILDSDAEVDNVTGAPVSSLSSSERPAEIPSSSPEVDTGPGYGRLRSGQALTQEEEDWRFELLKRELGAMEVLP